MNSNVYVRLGAFTSYTFMLSAGVRQGGVLSPILFCIYVDCIVQRLESSKLGCWIGELYVGCILYADDLTLGRPGGWVPPPWRFSPVTF